MISSIHFQLFEKYKSVGSHAFSNGLVSEADKDLYQELFETIVSAARKSIIACDRTTQYESWSARFFRDGGMQGQRPVDLWASVINIDSEVLGKYPQVYVIASEAGFEIGFGVAIHESDYYDHTIKQRNRRIVPILYSKLPSSNSDLVEQLDDVLAKDGFWKFGLKTRQGPVSSFARLTDLINFLKSPKSSIQGGGSVYRIISPAEVERADFILDEVVTQTLRRFDPLMLILRSTVTETTRLLDQQEVETLAEEIPDFVPPDASIGRKMVLRSVAVRQGQAKFREKLIDAYEGRCAVTGTNILATLQAAHISPYRGPETNSIQNGVLLRADIHNLFDLGLIRVDAETLAITVAEELLPTSFRKLQGRKIKLPKRRNHWPSKIALEERIKLLKQNEN